MQANICDDCKKAILVKDQAYVTQGNIYLFGAGGLIGDNFPAEVASPVNVKDARNEPFTIDKVKKVEMCVECFARALIGRGNSQLIHKWAEAIENIVQGR